MTEGADADPLVVMALPVESRGEFERAGVEVLYTGIGKVNAAIALTRALESRRARGRPQPLVLNFGSAGSPTLPTHSLVACNRFVQRDMDVSGLGFAPGVTPYEDEVPAELPFPPVFATLEQVVCGSGDRFETGAPRVACDVIDMEAYALAKACWRAGVAFGCAKYVTDGADHSAADDWAQNLPRAARAFVELYASLRAAVRP
jgi:adenosylhomocysteine nucleosidase